VTAAPTNIQPVTAGASSGTLTPTARERLLADMIGERVVAALTVEPTRAPTEDAATVADTLDVTRDFVPEHGAEPGRERVGTGPRGRLRFELERVRASLAACSVSNESRPPDGPAATHIPRRRRRRATAASNCCPSTGRPLINPKMREAVGDRLNQRPASQVATGKAAAPV
jgi:hypothetical protein